MIQVYMLQLDSVGSGVVGAPRTYLGLASYKCVHKFGDAAQVHAVCSQMLLCLDLQIGPWLLQALPSKKVSMKCTG